MIIKLSPLQGFTEYRFRNAVRSHFGGVDMYYAPYIRLHGEKVIKASCQRDLAPANNVGVPLIPQLMCREADDFLFVASYVQSLGYDELNWNLGCPYPMVTNRGLGSGLIKEVGQVCAVLDTVFDKCDIKVSVKMRLGYDDAEECRPLIKALNAFPLENITLHPRLGKQLYKGAVDLRAFDDAMKLSQHSFQYNGNIDSYESFLRVQERLLQVDTWWLGRGMISNPFLAWQIKEGRSRFPKDWRERFYTFHEELLQSYTGQLSGDKHVLMKMYQYWEYFHALFKDAKGLKKIRKAKNIHDYKVHVEQLLDGADLPVE